MITFDTKNYKNGKQLKSEDTVIVEFKAHLNRGIICFTIKNHNNDKVLKSLACTVL